MEIKYWCPYHPRQKFTLVVKGHQMIPARRPNEKVTLSDHFYFRSSTLLKKVTVPKRHLDSFAGYEYTLGAKRGVILHTDRYQVRQVCSYISQ